MKICLAQNHPISGDLKQNILAHQALIFTAVAQGANAILFSELSLTGYEPTLADKLATFPDDPRLNLFQKISNRDNITIGVGMPTRHEQGVCISMILFRPKQPRHTYSKQFLHDDEKPFFVERENNPVIRIGDVNIGIAICYELSVPAHAEAAIQGEADIYIASVAKHARGVSEASERLATLARRHDMPVLFVNAVGPADNFVGAGTSTVWDKGGVVIGQLGDQDEGLLIFDTTTLAVQKIVTSG